MEQKDGVSPLRNCWVYLVFFGWCRVDFGASTGLKWKQMLCYKDVTHEQKWRNKDGKCGSYPVSLVLCSWYSGLYLCEGATKQVWYLFHLCMWMRTLEMGITCIYFVSGAKDKAMINLVCYAKLCFWTAEKGICQWSALQECNPSGFLIIKFIFPVSVS